MDKKSNQKKIKNNRQYTLMVVLTFIVFLVIHLSFKYLFNSIIFFDVMPKQPMNNIKSVKKDVKKDDKKDDKKDNNKNIDMYSEDGSSPFQYVYTEDEAYGNYIYMDNQFPVADEIGKELEGQYKTFDFKFNFKNKALGANYVITLEKMSGTDLDETWVKVYLTNEGQAISNCLRTNGRIKTYEEYTKYNNNENEVILYQGKVTQNDIQRGYRNFRLRMWISEDVDINNEKYESKTIIARVNVHASGSN